MMVDVAVAVCSTISSHNSDETDLPSKCYVTIGAKSRYSYVKLVLFNPVTLLEQLHCSVEKSSVVNHILVDIEERCSWIYRLQTRTYPRTP